MTFTEITTEKLCQICQSKSASFTNDSGILFCEDCRNEAESLRKGKFKPGQPVTVRIHAKDLQALKQLSSETGRSLNYLFNLAVKSFLKKEAI